MSTCLSLNRLVLSALLLSLSVLVMEALLVVDCGAAQQAEADGEFSRSTTDKSLSHFPDLTVTFVFSSECFFFSSRLRVQMCVGVCVLYDTLTGQSYVSCLLPGNSSSPCQEVA